MWRDTHHGWFFPPEGCVEHHSDAAGGVPDLEALIRALRERIATITARLDAYHLLDAEVHASLDTLVSRIIIALDLFATLQRDAQRITALQDALVGAVGRPRAVAQPTALVVQDSVVLAGPSPELSAFAKGEIRHRLITARARGAAAYDAERTALRSEFGNHLSNARLGALLATAGAHRNGGNDATTAHPARLVSDRDAGVLTAARQCTIRLIVLRALATKNAVKIARVVHEVAATYDIGDGKVRAIVQLVRAQPVACAIDILAHIEEQRERHRTARELVAIYAALALELPDLTLLLQRALERRHTLVAASEQ